MKALKYLKYLNRKDLQVGHTYIIDGEYLYYDAVIAELEALQQPKSCYDCKHWFPNKASYPCNQCSMAINCLFEPKEQ